MTARRLRMATIIALLAGAAGWYGWTKTMPVVAQPVSADGWIGRAAPDFALQTLDHRIVKLSDFRGKFVLLNFWATWCAPCRVEMPWLVDFTERYHTRGLEIIGVSQDDGEPDKVAQFVQDMKVNYTILLKDDSVTDAYGGVRFLPQTFFIGPDGTTVARSYGIRSKKEFESDIGQFLGTKAPAP